MALVDGTVFEFKGKSVVRKEGDVALEGANASAEGEDADEGCDGSEQSGIDFVLNHKLERMGVYETKKPFLDYMKTYLKKLVAHMKKNEKSDEDVKAFQEKMQAWVKKLTTIFDKLEIYVGQFFCFFYFLTSSSECLQSIVGPRMAEGEGEGQLAIVEWRDTADGEFPFLILVKEGLIIEKC